MHVVGAGLTHGGEHSASGAPILGAERTGHQMQFLNRLDAGQCARAAGRRRAAGIIQIDAVQPEAVLIGTCAVHRSAQTQPGDLRAGGGSRQGHAAFLRGQVEQVASIQRQFVELALLDRTAPVVRRHAHQRSLRGHHHRLARLAQAEREVHSQRAACGQLQVPAQLRLEARLGTRHLIDARRESHRAILSAGVRFQFPHGSRPGLGNADQRAADHALRRVPNGAFHVPERLRGDATGAYKTGGEGRRASKNTAHKRCPSLSWANRCAGARKRVSTRSPALSGAARYPFLPDQDIKRSKSPV